VKDSRSALQYVPEALLEKWLRGIAQEKKEE